MRLEIPETTSLATATRTNIALPPAQAIPEALTRTATDIAAILRKIDGSVLDVSRKLPVSMRLEIPETTSLATATRTNIALPPAQAIPEALTRAATDIAAILRKIDGSVLDVSSKLPVSARLEIPETTSLATATRPSIALPRPNVNGGDDDAPGYIHPRDISPITQAERTAYSVEERINRIVIEVAAEKGTAARIVRAPRSADIKLVASGGNL
jgi:hypothetical protein